MREELEKKEREGDRETDREGGRERECVRERERGHLDFCHVRDGRPALLVVLHSVRLAGRQLLLPQEVLVLLVVDLHHLD